MALPDIVLKDIFDWYMEIDETGAHQYTVAEIIRMVKKKYKKTEHAKKVSTLAQSSIHNRIKKEKWDEKLGEKLKKKGFEKLNTQKAKKNNDENINPEELKNKNTPSDLLQFKKEETTKKLNHSDDYLDIVIDASAEIIVTRRDLAIKNLIEIDKVTKYKLECTKLKLAGKQPDHMKKEEYNHRIEQSFSDADLLKLRKQELDFVARVRELENQADTNDILYETFLSDKELQEVESKVRAINPEWVEMLEGNIDEN